MASERSIRSVMENSEIDRLAKIIWDYHLMHQKLEKADVILVLGSHDLRVAEYGAKLFLDGWAPLLIFSGGSGRVTQDWDEPEADKFAKIAIQMGVPPEKILIENKSTNTSENIVLTRKLLEEKKLNSQKCIVVQKPYMERRAYATFKKVWPEKDVIVTSPQTSFEEYSHGFHKPKDVVINVLVGDLQRLKVYAEKGFQISQEIPQDVWEAYEKLVAAGYTKHLIKI